MSKNKFSTALESCRYQTVNGISLYYQFYPHPAAPTTLICLHGFLASSFCFRHLIRRLKQDYQIVTIDIPPFGKSGKSLTFEYSYRNIARTLLQLLDHLGIKNGTLIGHSMGGQIALYMIHEQLNRFERAFLLASSGYLQRARLSAILFSYLPIAPILIKRHLIRTGGIQGNLEQVVHDKALICEEMKEGYLEPFLRDEAIFRALAKLLRDREGDLPEDVLRTITIPCYLLWGENDRIVPLAIGQRLANDLPSARLFVYEKTGHLLPEERPDDICELIQTIIC